MRAKRRFLRTCPYCRVNIHISRLKEHAESCSKRQTDYGALGFRIVIGSDFAACPNCGIKVLLSNIKEHLEAACKNRGIGKVKDFTLPKHISGCEVCGNPPIPGESHCYEHNDK